MARDLFSGQDDPRWIGWREVVEISGLGAEDTAALVHRGILPASVKRRVFEDGRWKWGDRWWRLSVELRLAEWRVSQA